MELHPKIEECSRLIDLSINMGKELPRSGHFESRDIINMVKRKDAINSIHKLLFPKLFTEYEELPDWESKELFDVHVSFKTTHKGFRFSKKADMFMVCKIDNDLESYTLIIPLHNENTELMLIGVLSFAEYYTFMEWAEYGLIMTNKISNKETKLHFKFSYSIGHGQPEHIRDISAHQYFCYIRLMVSAFKVFERINQNRIQSIYRNNDFVTEEDFQLMRIWSVMKIDVHCLNHVNRIKPKIPIVIEDSWDDFEGFKEWAINNGFELNKGIERINPDGHFIKTNVKWSDTPNVNPERYVIHYFTNEFHSATDVSLTPITINGVLKPVDEWSKISGLSTQVILGRFYSGLKDEAIIAPIKTKKDEFTNKAVVINGVTKTPKQLSEESGISLKTIISRIRYGWADEDLLSPPRSRANEK